MINQPISLATVTQPWIKAVVFGTSGVGKTVFSCASQYFRTFVFDVDDGTIAAKMWPHTRRDQVDIWPVQSREDFSRGYDWLMAHRASYQLVVVDTATELQKQVIREACIRKKVESADQQVWGIALNVMETIATGFHHLPCHVIWTCHETEREDPERRRIMFRPSFQGAFATAYAKHFSAILRLCKMDFPVADAAGNVIGHQTHRLLHCDGNQMTHAKNRGGALSEWEHPDVDQVLGKMIQAALADYGYGVQNITPQASTQEVAPVALPPHVP